GDSGNQDVASRQFRADCVRKTGERKFAGGVGSHVRHSNSSPNGRNIHDATAAVRAHAGGDEQVEDKRSPKMQTHGAIEILELHMLDRTDFDNAGVANQDVDLAEV